MFGLKTFVSSLEESRSHIDGLNELEKSAGEVASSETEEEDGERKKKNAVTCGLISESSDHLDKIQKEFSSFKMLKTLSIIMVLVIEAILLVAANSQSAEQSANKTMLMNNQPTANYHYGNMSSMLMINASSAQNSSQQIGKRDQSASTLATNSGSKSMASSAQATTKGASFVTGSRTVAPTNSPAVNSRLKQTVNPNTSGGRSTMMMAEDTHDNQATFVTINSAATSVSDPNSARPKASAGATGRIEVTVNSGPRASGSNSAPGETKTNKHNQQQASGVKGGSNSRSVWSASQPSTNTEQTFSAPPVQWRQKSIKSSSNYQQMGVDYPSPAAMPMSMQQAAEVAPEVSQAAAFAQVEKPNGYSYETSMSTSASSPSSSAALNGTTSYTHTSPLSPVRQELMSAEQVATKRSQRYQPQPSTSTGSSRSQQHYDRSSGLVQSGAGQVEQLTISGKSSNQAPDSLQQQYIAQQQQQQQLDYGPPTGHRYAGGHGGHQHPSSPAQQYHSGSHHEQQPFAMMPAPHLSITGTAANPCKPPASPLGMDGVQVNEISSSGSSSALPQALPNFSTSTAATAPKYQRVGGGTRLRSQYIFKVIRADSLTDCESACSRASQVAGNNPQEACRSFNYRPYFAAENCELSRHELRSLKLEDGAQFEQHTQFDFYALDPQQQQAAAAAASLPAAALMAAASSHQALAYSPFPEADCLDVSQSCTQDGMEFTLRTSEPFNGRIYTYGFYDSCFFDGEGSSTSVLRVSRSNGFPRCGTQQFGDLMTNIVVVQFNDYVQTTRDKKYNLTCYFSGPGEAVVTSNYLDTRIDERSHPMQIEHLPPQNVITSNVHLRVLYRGQPTNTIAVGDLLTFRLETRAAQHRAVGGDAGLSSGSNASPVGGQSEIFATNVLAKDPYSGRQVQLIDSRGCPIDPVNVFPELQRTPDGALESEFYAFKIPDSNFLIFQATVRTCKAPCEPVICHSSTSHSSSPALDQIRGQYLLSGGTKGGSYLGGALHAAHQSSSSVPSWGKRRRRRSMGLGGFDDDGSSQEEFVSAGETVEHVIPVRLGGSGQLAQQSSGGGHPREVTTIRRPELSEAEEEVKEMFRVYMSRAEINRQRQRDRQQGSSDHNPSQGPLMSPQVSRQQEFGIYGSNGSSNSGDNQAFNAVMTSQSQSSPLIDSSNAAEQELTSSIAASQDTNLMDQICMAQSNYYVMLFTVISLSLVMSSVLFVSLYIAKKAKFHISDSIADSIF